MPGRIASVCSTHGRSRCRKPVGQSVHSRIQGAPTTQAAQCTFPPCKNRRITKGKSKWRVKEKGIPLKRASLRGVAIVACNNGEVKNAHAPSHRDSIRVISVKSGHTPVGNERRRLAVFGPHRSWNGATSTSVTPCETTCAMYLMPWLCLGNAT